MRTVTDRPQRTPGLEAPVLRLPHPMLALTFDDGPDPEHTPPLLDLLAGAEVRATFFVLGDRAVRHPALVRRIIDEGHAVGSHGWSHAHPWWQSRQSAIEDVTKAAEALADLCGERVRWFRPPFGRLRRCMRIAADLEGQRLVLWSRSVIDWGPFGTPSGIQRRLRAASPGDILLLHDARNKHNRPDATLHALSASLPELCGRLQLLNLDQAQPTG
jgi:peptidoglycan-N-acetylglucosamine deacetylase